MKHLRVLYLIMAVWLSFSGIALGKTTPIFNKVPAERTAVKNVFNNFKYHPEKVGIKFSCKKQQKTPYLRSYRKVEMKRKATQLETVAMSRLYLSQFILIKQFADNRNYGLSKLYSVALHTYLHLYQLF